MILVRPGASLRASKEVTHGKGEGGPPGYHTVTPFLNLKGAAEAISDRFGNRWAISTHKEDVPPAEMGKRAAEAIKKMPKP